MNENTFQWDHYGSGISGAPLPTPHQRIYPHPNPQKPECECNWEESLNFNLVKILKWYHPALSGWALNLMTSVLIEGRHRVEDHMKMEAEVGVMQWQAKEHLKPTEAGRSREGFFPSVLEEMQPCWHLEFRFLASNYDRINFRCLKSSSLWSFVMAALEN